MRRLYSLLILIATLACLGWGQSSISNGANLPLGGTLRSRLSLTSSNSSASIQAATDRAAGKFFAKTTAPITCVDAVFAGTGTTTGITVTVEIETDSAGAPSGTVLGTASAAFTPVSTNFTGTCQALGTNTGALTVNTPYWVVFRDGGGTAPTSSNNWKVVFTASQSDGGTLNRFTASAWGAGVTGDISAIFSDGTNFWGNGNKSAGTLAIQSIFGTSVGGVKLTLGTAVNVVGLSVGVTVTGTPPGNMELQLYRFGTAASLASVSIPPASLGGPPTGGYAFQFILSSPLYLTPGVYYIVVDQAGAVGSSSNCYKLVGISLDNNAYWPAYATSTTFFVTGASYTAGTTVPNDSNLVPVQTKLPVIGAFVGGTATGLQVAPTAAPIR